MAEGVVTPPSDAREAMPLCCISSSPAVTELDTASEPESLDDMLEVVLECDLAGFGLGDQPATRDVLHTPSLIPSSSQAAPGSFSKRCSRSRSPRRILHNMHATYALAREDPPNHDADFGWEHHSMFEMYYREAEEVKEQELAPKQRWVAVRGPPLMPSGSYVHRCDPVTACRADGLPLSFAIGAGFAALFGGTSKHSAIIMEMAAFLPADLQHRGEELLREAAAAGVRLMGTGHSILVAANRHLLEALGERRAKGLRRFYIGITERPTYRYKEHVEAGYDTMLLWMLASSAESASLEQALINKWRGHPCCKNVGAGGLHASGGKPHFLYIVSQRS